MANYDVALPNYSVGAGCYAEVPRYARTYGTTAVVIGGETAMGKGRPYLDKGVAGSGLQILAYLPYGGNSTYENGDALKANPLVQKADMVFGMGGGRACDTAKYVANELGKPLFTFPTVGSNCASVTAISVIYNADGTFREYYYPRPAVHTFINTAVIADSPVELLWAGIGDALSKEPEAVFSSKDDVLAHTPLLGVQLSHACTEPLVQHGVEAMNSIKTKTESDALREVVLDIIISTGIVSNLVSHVPEYYYNSTLAHCVYYGATVTKNGEKHLHGEVVSLGVLCLLTYAKDFAMRDRLMAFNDAMGLPVDFDDIEITEDEFGIMADKAVTTVEWEHRPKGVTREGFIQCMKDQNEAGRKYKAEHKK